MIHTKTLGDEAVGPRVIYQNKAIQFLGTFYPETAATKSWNRVVNKRRVVCPLRMSEELMDPAIKLFGKTISFPQPDLFSGSRDDDDLGSQTSSNAAVHHDNKGTSGEEELPTCENEVESSDPTEEASEDNEEKEEDQEKTLKKPDKILPCPRCNSMDTKFCYYNNYNVNQPRYFCKNCQRYWTAGGSMRNVPVGSGRRKNKSACSSKYRHIMGTDHCPKANGTILTFGSENPLCESMASALDLSERSSSNSNSTEADSRNYLGFVPIQHAPPPPFPCPQWPYPSFPAAYYPSPPYWGCVAPGPWNMPWLHLPQPQHHSCSDHSGYGPGPDPPMLGKHGRDGENITNDHERTILVPKTLRIDDPAKSSIWSTLGIKNECINGERLFKSAFSGKGKGNSKMHVDDTSLVMQANPAAFSRSQCFHEST